MITLKLDDQQAFFLSELFVECNQGIFEKEIFKTFNEGLNKYTYDHDYKAHIEEIEVLLDKARGLK